MPVPPKSFYKLSKSEQETEAVRRMNSHYELAEEWKKLARDARKRHIPEPEIDRTDLLELKGEN